jgi:hypothetical protein
VTNCRCLIYIPNISSAINSGGDNFSLRWCRENNRAEYLTCSQLSKAFDAEINVANVIKYFESIRAVGASPTPATLLSRTT